MDIGYSSLILKKKIKLILHLLTSELVAKTGQVIGERHFKVISPLIFQRQILELKRNVINILLTKF